MVDRREGIVEKGTTLSREMIIVIGREIGIVIDRWLGVVDRWDKGHTQ